MLSIYSISLGCPKNRVDTERLLGSVAPGRVRLVESPAEAQLVLINSCAFIAPAIQESVSVILECAAELAEMPEDARPLLAVAGCLPGRFGRDSLAGEIPEVDLWLETADMENWPLRLADALRAWGRLRGPAPRGLIKKAGAERGRALSTGPSYAWLKISEGCGQACSFCTIPLIRGRVRSSTADELLTETRALLDEGVKEIILVAQDLTSWGRDLPGKPDLRGLLEGLLPLDGLERLRLMYLYPAGLTEDLLSFAAGAGPRLLPYFDVPLQHSHPDILSRMGRPFAQSPLKVVDRIRKYLPGAALRTSLIAGFPGEGEAEFEDLCRVVEEVRFQNLGVFAYQAEEGTPAAALPGQLPEAVKAARRDRIMEIQEEISAEILRGYLGERLEVLVDAPHPEWPGLFVGRAWFQAPEADGVVYVSGEGVAAGDLVGAEVTETFAYDLNALV